MADQDEQLSIQTSNSTAGNEASEPPASTMSTVNPPAADSNRSDGLASASNPTSEVAVSEGGNPLPPPPGDAKEDRDPSSNPGQPLTDHPPPALIEKISLADKPTPPDGQLQEEKPRSESREIQISNPSKQEHLTSGVTKSPALPPPLSSSFKNTEPETVSIHGKSHTTSSPSSSSASHANIGSSTSLPALSRIMMPYPLTNDAGRPMRHLGLEHINAFAVKISAAVEGAGGKPVELVQHTPKRDKGPQMQPSFIRLIPQSASPSQYSGLGSSLVKSGAEYDYNYSHSHLQHQPLNQAVYDRIQFKSATANNGKRRAAQQYYHLIVELYAEVINNSGGEPEGTYVLVAKRTSAPMVVRGRSPGHYVDERKHNRPTSAGPDSKGSGTQPSTPATAFAPTGGMPTDIYYAKSTLPAMGVDHGHCADPMGNEADQPSYAYYPQTLNQPYDSRPSNNHAPFNGYYFSGGVHDAFKAYQPLGISCSTYGDSTYGYIPSSGRSRVKNEGAYNSLSWPRDTPRVEYQRSHMPDKMYATESSSQHYPSLPTL
ncbi:hypothetical protein Dda_6517 [Drechslerella dactyloides]|uniref:NDT80 domain-containing protein n=1 Tax=Drechslerella dactyloides TaxID=74499 RepID=A0AAD6NHH5_DREDA|nr:hypothetical protein Dda_6517 [Drechslerella dactyloides]